MDEIERQTALTWGGRAAASYQLSEEAKTLDKRFERFYEGENYRQEAFEHASMAEDRGKLLREIRDEIEAARESALDQLHERLTLQH